MAKKHGSGKEGGGAKAKAGGKGAPPGPPLSDLLRLPPGEAVDLSAHDSRATPGGPKGKAAGARETAALAEPLGSLQERLYAASTAGDVRRLLLVLQGMDTSGKDGTVKHVIGLFNPAGCRIRSFKEPTEEELAHAFLWRVKRALPAAGEIGIFNRSHYEDVLVARVRSLVPHREIRRRYGQINRFEQSLADRGVRVVKVFLHIGYEEQRRRLLARLDDPDKHWKFSEGDLEDRDLWPRYRDAYETALTRCAGEDTPWYLVPADRKWYRNWAISTLLREHLAAMDPRFPAAGFDVAAARDRLLATP
ncbi:PPK2 family polyphosphate kinase [Streptomyces fuscigenes]|uniref:PPK2 family polyphosphate kinase n=1 Tax=Streptomyces fuscigenes TaxID=1528880 RepID=UPI001F2345EB|nr:PPK2 family polyphosphate kinase [Streptomyces fuscigenes]MCF3964953.1 polyphosphate kinase 2 family protein [Streptomyces fuscigenes]